MEEILKSIIERFETEELTDELEKRKLFTNKLPASVIKKVLDSYMNILNSETYTFDELQKIASSTVKIYNSFFKEEI